MEPPPRRQSQHEHQQQPYQTQPYQQQPYQQQPYQQQPYQQQPYQQQPYQQQPYQQQPYQQRPHQQQPVAASTQTITSVVDVRRQIIANALRRHPDIVRAHVTKFSNIPVRAEDVFDVTIYPNIELFADGSGGRTYLARLTHADNTDLATRVILLGGRSERTVEGALHSLLVLSSE